MQSIYISATNVPIIALIGPHGRIRDLPRPGAASRRLQLFLQEEDADDECGIVVIAVCACAEELDRHPVRAQRDVARGRRQERRRGRSVTVRQSTILQSQSQPQSSLRRSHYRTL